MKICSNCGQQTLEEDKFCVNCGTDMTNSSATEATPKVEANSNYAASGLYNNENQNILDNEIVRFVLYVQCIFASVIGLILALILSNTPFQGQKELSIKMIRCSCISMVMWSIVGVLFIFIGGFFAALI